MRLLRCLALATVMVGLVSAPARAEGFIIPFVGSNFGGDSGCPSLNDCTDKRLNVGVSLGSMGTAFGFEEDLSWTKNFFGDVPDEDNSVFTAMSNLLIGVGVGPVRPYVVGGVGLIRSHVSSLRGSVTTLESGKTAVGYDVGGGLTGLVGGHVGIRGDVRLFRTMQDVDILIFSGEKLSFWRASLGLALVF